MPVYDFYLENIPELRRLSEANSWVESDVASESASIYQTWLRSKKLIDLVKVGENYLYDKCETNRELWLLYSFEAGYYMMSLRGIQYLCDFWYDLIGKLEFAGHLLNDERKASIASFVYQARLVGMRVY